MVLNIMTHQRNESRTSLAVQWLRLHASTAGGLGSIPGWVTKIPHAHGAAKKKKTEKKRKENHNEIPLYTHLNG